MKRIPILIILLLFISGCGPRFHINTDYFTDVNYLESPCDCPSPDELEVLSTFYHTPRKSDSLWVSAFFDSTGIIQADSSYILRSIDKIGDTAKVAQLIREFNKINSRRYAFCPRALPLMSKIYIIRRSDFRNTSNDKDVDLWRTIDKKYPRIHEITSISRIAFSQDKKMAMVHMEELCDPLCGSGRFIFLKYCDGEWYVWRSVLEWIS